MPVLRVAHISDTHFGVAPPARHPSAYARRSVWRYTFARALGYCNGAQGHEPDARSGLLDTIRGLTRLRDVDAFELVHSGDLTCSGRIDDLVQEQRELSDAIGRTRVRTLTLGNHDLWPDHFPTLAAEDTARHAAEVYRSLSSNGLEFPAYTCCWDAMNVCVQFFTLDSCIADSYWNWRACGKLCDVYFKGRKVKQLDALQRLIARVDQVTRACATPVAGHKTAFRVALLHHPALNFDGNRRKLLTPMALVDNGVANKLEDLGFRLLLCGHEHVPSPQFDVQGGLLQISVGTPTHSGDPNKHFAVLYLRPVIDPLTGAVASMELKVETWVRGYLGGYFLSPDMQRKSRQVPPGSSPEATWSLGLTGALASWVRC